MYTQEQVDKLQLKLNELKIAKNRFISLQHITWLRIDFGYNENSCKCVDLPISSNTTEKIQELLLAEYTSRVKTLQDEIENTIIINPSKL